MDGLELLVHNLSHSDIVLSLNDISLSKKPNSVIARPKFSHFHGICERILRNVTGPDAQVSVTQTKLFSRRTGQEVSDDEVAVGFNFTKNPIVLQDLSTLRFRHDDKNTLLKSSAADADTAEDVNEKSDSQSCVIESAYFPLIAVLLPKWLGSIDEDRRQDFNKVVVLVSGRGTPMIQSSGNANDNSTKCTGELIKVLIQKAYPAITVKLLHSDSNLFRYDENIVFVKGQLLPMINQYRDQLVCTKGADWKEHMRVSLSFADGSSARISAINASLRYYRPAYMHFWQLKSFWREQMICEDDIECHSYEEISTEPAIKIENTRSDPLVHAVITEMSAFRAEFSRVTQDGVANDLGSFWLRKTKKPVLAVLLVQKPGQPFRLYRGTNMEVSMPTGSLCAERNVIGTALSADITLRREDIKIVAVYAASMAPPQSGTPGASQLHRGSSTSSHAYGYGGFSKQNSLTLPSSGSAEEVVVGILGSESDTAGVHAMQSPKRSSSISFSDTLPVHSRSGPVTPNRSREGTTDYTGDATCYPCRDSPGLTPIDTTYPGDLPYPPSQADTPVMGTPSPQHGAFGGRGNGAKSPQLGAKRKIMSITQQMPGGAEESNETAAGKAALPDTVSVQPSAAPVGRGTALTRQVLSAAAGQAVGHTTGTSTSKASSASNGTSNGTSSGTSRAVSSTTASNSRRRTKTVAFSASSNNLASHHSPSPVDASFLDQSDIMNTSHPLLASPNTSTLDFSVTDLADLTASNTTLASAVKSLPNHNCPVETETITVDKDDLNPLKPCGACNEWLKKIAEVNPQLRVITFTDAGCRGVHIEQIDD